MTEIMTAQEFQEKLKTGIRAKPGKYKSIRTTVDNIVFDSKAEAVYYERLCLRLRANEIEAFNRQVPYQCWVNGHLVCSYVADFVIRYHNGKTEIIDVKGVETPVFKLKRKLLFACLGIDIVTVNLSATAKKSTNARRTKLTKPKPSKG